VGSYNDLERYYVPKPDYQAGGRNKLDADAFWMDLFFFRTNFSVLSKLS